MIEVGVIGLGKMGKLHFQNCLHIDGIRIKAVSDSSTQNLSWASKYCTGKSYQNYEDLLEKEDLDAVIIALPHSLHEPSSNLAFENGIDVFLEKPMATSYNEGVQISNSCKKNSRKLMIGCNCRFIESIQKIKQAYDKGNIGDVEIATLENIGNGPFSPFLDPTPVSDWYFNKAETGGGCVMDLGYHMIDLFIYFFGNTHHEYSLTANRYLLPYEDSAISIIMSTETNTKGVINLGWFCRSIFPKFDFNMTLHGTADYISSKDFTPNLYLNAIYECSKNLSRRAFKKKIEPLKYTYYYHSYYLELMHFFNSVKIDSEPIVTINDSLNTMKIIDKIYNNQNEKE